MNTKTGQRPDTPGSRIGRVMTSLHLTIKENLRNPALVGLMLFLPVYFLTTVRVGLSGENPVPMELGKQTVTPEMGDVYMVIGAGMVGPVIAGIAGLFLVQKVKKADSRLVLVGYRSWELLLSRFLYLMVVVSTITVISVGYILVYFSPEQLGWFVLSVVLASLIYGLLGLLIGTVLSKLAGLYVMLFAPMMDALIFQNPMFSSNIWWTDYLPANHPMEMSVDAAFTTGIDTLGNAGWSLAYLGIVGVLSVSLFYRLTRVH